MRRLITFSNNKYVCGCKKCGLRGLRPLPDYQKQCDLYGHDEYFNVGLADLHADLVFGYNEKSPIIQLYQRHLQNIIKFKSPPGHLLEIGCARGVFLDLARKKGYKVNGTEMNQDAVSYAQKNFNLEVCQESIENAQFEGESFDVIAAFDVIEHLINPQLLIEKAYKILKPKGILVIGTPSSTSPICLVAEQLAVFSAGRYQYPAFRFYGKAVEHLNIFNPQNLELLLKSHGFQQIGAYNYNIPLANMCDISIIQRCAISILSMWPYEFVLISQKE